MLKRKKREFRSSELMQAFAKIHGFEHKLLALEIKNFLLEFIDENHHSQIKTIDLLNKILVIRIASPMFKNDFHLRKLYYLTKIQDEFGDDTVTDIEVI